MKRSFLAASAALICLAAFCTAGSAAEYRVRPVWGNEALWGYWEYDNDYLPTKDWKIVSVSQEGGGDAWKSPNLIDGDGATFYYASGQDAYEFVLDLGTPETLGAFSVLTLERPNAQHDSMMAGYELYVSDAPDSPGQAVAKGDFQGETGKETIVAVPAAKGRYVRLKAFARPNANKELCLREFRLVSADTVARHQTAKAAAAAEKKANWQDRDSDKAVEAFGKDFLDMIFCTQDDINRSNLRARPKLEEAGKLKAAGKYADGLKAFRDYYFDKLRRPTAFGLHANDVHPYGAGYAGIGDFPQGALEKNLDAEGQKKQIAAAEELLKGIMTLGNGTKVEIGEPGAVDWMAPGAPYGYTTKTRTSDPYRELWWGNGFQPLVSAYIITKNEAYLKRWIAYMDDWAMNANYLMELHPVVNHDNCLYPVVTAIRSFAAIANSLPYDSEAVPPAAFARIMKKLVVESPLNEIVYMRSNPNAWTPGAGFMLMTILLDEFKVSPLYFRETRRRNIEDINVLQVLRDGTESHQWPGYNFLLLVNAGAMRLMEARDTLPDWAQPVWERELHDVGWQRELTESLVRRATYLLHWGTPNGEYPLVTHQEPPNEKRFKLRESYNRLPAMLNDPLNARLYSTLYGDGRYGTPEYTSEWFPYGGYSIARAGWNRNDGYASMFCSPQPGCGGVGSGCKNNAFSLTAFGMDLLTDDLVHAYIRPTSPIQVDKKRQQFDFYVPKTGWPTAHRGDLIGNWTDLSPWRWHSSGKFDLIEGVYSGVYANEFRNRQDFLNDVSHQRLALCARRAGVWILTDRLLTKAKHDYEQLWWLPLKKKEYAGFKPEEIVIDAAAKTLKTRRTGSDKWWSWGEMRDMTVGNVNLSFYQFTDAPLTYDSKTVKSDAEMYDWQRVAASWQGEGNQQVVTMLYPRKPTPEKAQPDGAENDLVSVKTLTMPQGVTAFTAQTLDGYNVTYLASANQEGALDFGGIAITGESLLVVRGPAGDSELTGIALGCKQMKVKGAKIAAVPSDFEFALPASLDAGKIEIKPIYRPIAPVQILPESDVFVGQLEVTLQCPTPGVHMTYTLDGTEPTPQSAPYKDPFTIDHTRVVKARAYRAGVAKNPPHTSGTHATPVSDATFTKKLPYTAEQVAPQSQGLNVAYYEGFWKDLWLSMDKVAPKTTGVSKDLFDLSILPADNRPLGDALAPREKTYALKYTGYLKAPEDGIYTIYAPHEYVHCDQIAGYELQVYLGHAVNPDGSGVKRDGDMSFWYPATRLHGFGTWSAPLKKGFHEFKIVYIDFRMDGAKRLNKTEGVRGCVWTGEKPDLLISGPGIQKQPIPAEWLWK